MTKTLVTIMAVGCLAAGCDSLRFAPTETQKQNAWLHLRTTQLAADKARTENTSPQIQGLTSLSTVQSRAFASYYGMPKELPQADTAEQVLAESSRQLAQTALQQSADRPDAWQVADSALELAIGVAALLGGVYGTKAVRFLKQTRNKSQALREIIEGNELFKEQNAESVSAFKAAHKDQAAQTKQIVTETKAIA